ncbi:PQQ-binding-like beta-propeller repeat protein [uncultured Arcticibacterium sp.]|uniref:outer membrane protein assembly factor BamB family protein n=1 Tax=uncultured Arcticibacterium sp. TaxID=2173042 RepID=UPI0030F6F475
MSFKIIGAKYCNSFSTALVTLCLLLVSLFSFSQDSWTTVLPTVGTFSSPRVSDLNGDGVKDIILGAGRLEFEACDSAMIALDGTNGDILWKVPAIDQIFVSAALLDINLDGVDDVFLGGRSSELKAINGKTGDVFWSFDTLKYSENGAKRWFNFYNPQFIHDVDQDGIQDILIANGGDIMVEPHDPNRAAGRLCIISSKTGVLLADATMPDEHEIYMSAAVDMDLENPLASRVIFGTGGETTPGNLFVGTLDMVLKGDLSASQKLANGFEKGFISPPAWVDINEDGIRDIVSSSVDGRLLAFDGKTNKDLWQMRLPNTEAYSSMAIGMFNEDEIPDFFVSYAQGVWPDLSWTRQAMVNGLNGEIEYLDSLGYYQTSSPVVVDLTGDGIDEVVLSVGYQVLDSLNRMSFYSTLYAIEFIQENVLPMVDGLPGHNEASTPWLGDLDGDGLLDIVYCHGINKYQTYTFDGLRVNCLKTTAPISKPIKWGAYMGSDYNGVYK